MDVLGDCWYSEWHVESCLDFGKFYFLWSFDAILRSFLCFFVLKCFRFSTIVQTLHIFFCVMALASFASQGTPNSPPSLPPALAASSDDGDLSAAIDEVVLSVVGTDASSPPPCPPSATTTFTVAQPGNSSFSESGDSDDDCPLINLRTRARQLHQSLSHAVNVEEPLVEGPPGSLPDRVAKLFAEVENHTSSTQAEEPPHTVGVTRRFTRSQANKVLAAPSESRKKRRPTVPVSAPPTSDFLFDSAVTDSCEFIRRRKNKIDIVCPTAESAFRSNFHRGLWPFVCARSLLREHSLMPSCVKDLSIVEHLSDIGLAKTVLNVPSFVLGVVLEFYSNLSSDTSDIHSPTVFTTFVRRVSICFSPDIINEYLGFTPLLGMSMTGGLHLVVSEITGGSISTWPESGWIRSSSLSHKYSIYHKIALRNWMPSTHSSTVRADLACLLYQIGTKGALDFGKLVFESVMSHAESQLVNKPLCFPSLLFGIIQAQTNVIGDTEVYEKDSPPVVITDKLRNSTYHVNDIPAAVSTDATVVHVTSPSSVRMVLQDRIIHDLTLEVEHLTKLIKSSQARKDMLMSLISDVKAAAASTSAILVGSAPMDDSV